MSFNSTINNFRISPPISPLLSSREENSSPSKKAKFDHDQKEIRKRATDISFTNLSYQFKHCYSSNRVSLFPSHFTILKNNTPFEIYSSYLNSLSFKIENLLTKKIEEFDLNSIRDSKIIDTDLKKWGQSRIICSDLYDKTWVALDSYGFIFCVDIETNTCSTLIVDSEPCTDIEYSAKIRFNGQEIMIGYHDKIDVWDAQTSLLTHTIKISPTNIQTLSSTAHFIIYTSSEGCVDPEKLFFIQKQTRKITPVEDRPFDPNTSTISFVNALYTIATSANYLAILRFGQIRIFKDDETQLTLIHTVKDLALKGFMHIYQNWLILNGEGQLRIWDIPKIQTDKPFFLNFEDSIKGQIMGDFRANTTQIVFKNSSKEKATHTIFNFEDIIKELASIEKEPKLNT